MTSQQLETIKRVRSITGSGYKDIKNACVNCNWVQEKIIYQLYLADCRKLSARGATFVISWYKDWLKSNKKEVA